MRALLLTLAVAGCGDAVTGGHPALLATPMDAPDCVPDLDGRITGAELPFGVGFGAAYAVSRDAPVDVVGAGGGWDWAADRATDRSARVAGTPLAGAWYADAFPDADFAYPLDAAGVEHAVYSLTDHGLLLHGRASADGDDTLVVYAAPVTLYPLPLEAGREWTSVGEVRDGRWRGLEPYSARETYTGRVDGQGRLQLPDATFNRAMRVRVDLEVQPLLGPTVRERRVSFLFECFGEVARATSHPDEPAADFQRAAEVRRLVFR